MKQNVVLNYIFQPLDPSIFGRLNISSVTHPENILHGILNSNEERCRRRNVEDGPGSHHH